MCVFYRHFVWGFAYPFDDDRLGVMRGIVFETPEMGGFGCLISNEWSICNYAKMASTINNTIIELESGMDGIYGVGA